jgi:Rrf2 family iron-sulfur cluster assembly transcriptional regulator
MKLTTKGRYAIIAMVDLAINGAEEPAPLKEISTRQKISLSYLEQLFSKLRISGLVKSIRGPGGGYILNKNPSNLNLLDIITAVDEKIDQTQCGGAMNCIDDKPCLTHFIWTDLNNKINDYMREITLSDITLRKDVQSIIFLRENKNVIKNQRPKE